MGGSGLFALLPRPGRQKSVNSAQECHQFRNCTVTESNFDGVRTGGFSPDFHHRSRMGGCVGVWVGDWSVARCAARLAVRSTRSRRKASGRVWLRRFAR